MSQSRRRAAASALVGLVAVAVFVAGVLAAVAAPPEIPWPVFATLAGTAVLGLVGGAYAPEAAHRTGLPLMAAVTLAVIAAASGDSELALVPIWGVMVIAGFGLRIGPSRAAMVEAAMTIVSGGVLVAVTPYVDLNRAPFDRAIVGAVAFAITHTVLERLISGSVRRFWGAHTWYLLSASVMYASGLTLVVDQLAHHADPSWRPVAVAALVGLGGLALMQVGRIAVLQRVTHALTEAATTTPWPAAEVDATLVRLVRAHVRAAAVTIEPNPGGSDTLNEEIAPGSVLVVRRVDGDIGFSSSEISLVEGLAAMARASHDQTARESELWVAAVTDELTGLWMFEQWRDHLREQSRARSGGEKLAVVFLDLDHFKQINSEYGHLRADVLLTAVGERLAQETRWRFGRFGGDEFVGVARGVRDEAHLDDLCRMLAAGLRAPVDTGDMVITVTATIGRVLSANRSESPDVILAMAERDLRERKAARNAMGAAPGELVDLTALAAMDDGEILGRILDHGIDVAYQPILDLRRREVVGWEALLRGALPLIGSLAPERLVDSAVRAGVMDLVTRQVATQAFLHSEKAAELLGRPMVLSINIEQDQFQADSSLIKWLIDRAARSPLTLVLELTERPGARDWGEAEDDLAAALEAEGIHLALDDLGSGTSRTALLARRPWYAAKLDRSLLADDPRTTVMLHHMVALMRDLGLGIIMEGVETVAQIELVESLGIDRAQGHFFSPACTGDELLAFLARYGGPGGRPPTH